MDIEKKRFMGEIHRIYSRLSIANTVADLACMTEDAADATILFYHIILFVLQRMILWILLTFP